MVSEGLAITLKSAFPDLECKQRGTAREAIEFIESEKDKQHCLVLLDMVLPDKNGITVLQHIYDANLHEKFPCIVMSGTENQGNVELCKKYLARGFVPKSGHANELIDAVGTVLKGGVYFSEDRYGEPGNFLEIATHLVPHLQKTLDLVLQGLRSKNIADELGISQKTVENNVNRLHTLFSVTTRAELIRQAQDCGYVPQYKNTKK
jgi:DNA-binding NarL/FixJ family response regulator